MSKQIVELRITRNGETTKHMAFLEITENGPTLNSPVTIEKGDVLEFRAVKEGQVVEVKFHAGERME